MNNINFLNKDMYILENFGVNGKEFVRYIRETCRVEVMIRHITRGMREI